MNAQWTSAAVMIILIFSLCLPFPQESMPTENSLCIHKIQAMNCFPRWNFLLVHIFGHNPKCTCTVLWSWAPVLEGGVRSQELKMWAWSQRCEYKYWWFHLISKWVTLGKLLFLSLCSSCVGLAKKFIGAFLWAVIKLRMDFWLTQHNMGITKPTS